jgi:hypothetical protein
MTDKTLISAEISPTNPDAKLGLEIWIDNMLIKDINPVVEPVYFQTEIDDADGKHELKFVLKNKLPEHTTIDSNGDIIADALITISDIQFDEIKLGHLVHEIPKYTHNFNGAGPEVVESFNNSMGCNGSVVLKFTTPVYLWLLEHM